MLLFCSLRILSHHVQITQYVLNMIFLKIYVLNDLLMKSMMTAKIIIVYSFQISNKLAGAYIVGIKFGLKINFFRKEIEKNFYTNYWKQIISLQSGRHRQ